MKRWAQWNVSAVQFRVCESELSRGRRGRFVMGGFHPQLSGDHENGEQDSAEKKDSAHAGVLGEHTAEEKAGDLRGEDEGHDG